MRKSHIKPMPKYFERYIRLVNDAELLQAFDGSLTQLDDLDQNLPAKPGDRKYAIG